MRPLAGALFGLLALGQTVLPEAAAAAGDPRLDAPFRASPATLLAIAREALARDSHTQESRAQDGLGAGTAVVVLHRQVTHRFDEAGRVTYRRHLVYRLVDASPGDVWSRTEVDYAPWHQARPAVRARIVTPGGRELWLDARNLEEEPAPGARPEVVTDRVRLVAPLPTLEPGAVVEEEVVVRDLEPFFKPGIAAVEALQMYAPIVYSRVVLEAPVGLALRYSVHQWPELAPRQRLDEDRVELIFEFRDLPAALPPEAGLPSHRPRFPHLAFSTGESWNAVAVAYSRLVEEAIAAGTRTGDETGDETSDETLARLAAAAGAPSTPRRQRVAALLAALRAAVSYTGVELGDASLVPAPPALTLERGAGDCKDQATLLVALLRRAGIEAHLALLERGPGEDVDPRLPGLGRFDHALVFVPAGGEEPPLWIDPSEPAARAGELPVSLQGRFTLVIRAVSERLLRTPSTDSIANRIVEVRRVRLADHGPGRVVESSTWSGQPEIEQRRITLEGPSESRRRGYEDYVAATYGASGLGRLEESDPDDLSRPFSLTLEALDAAHAETDLESARVKILLAGLVTGLPPVLLEEGEPRRQPLIVTPPFINEWHYRIVPPAGFEIATAPADEERRLGPARLLRRARFADGEWQIDFIFDSGPRILSPEQFEAMRRDLRQWLDEGPLSLEFVHRGLAAIEAGRPGEGFEILRRLVDEHPAAPVHRVRLVKALVDADLGGEAVRRARRAAELAPGSALAHWALGYALEHDEVGRRFRAGFPRREVLQALERAVELAPEDPLSRAALALALERGAGGRKFGRGADVDAAVEHYRILREELGASGIEGNLLLALIAARRFEEVVELAPATHTGELGLVLYLAARAAVHGADAAWGDATRLETRGAARFRLLEAAAQKLVETRLYDAAAELLRRAASSAPRGAAVRARAVHLERTRPWEDVLAGLAPEAADEDPHAAPAALARRLLILALAGEAEPAELRALFHPRYLAAREARGEGLEAILSSLRRRQPAVAELPPSVMLDLLLTVVEAEVDGDPARGFRVRLRDVLTGNGGDGNGGRVIFRLYLTRHEGRLVIAALDGELGQIGQEVWRRLERDDLRGAHRFLEWAADEMPAGAGTPPPAGDPWSFIPFARFWTRGTGAFKDKMRLGAALLMVDQPEATAALPVLEAARHETLDERASQAVELGLFWAHHQLAHQEELATAAERLAARHPGSLLAFVGHGQALLAAERYSELESLARAWLESRPGDPPALRFLARAAAARGESAAAEEHFAVLRDSGRIEPGDYNDWAWLLLFQHPVPEKALELARSGAELAAEADGAEGDNARGAVLHTVATAAAELEHPVEAREALLASLAARGDGGLGGGLGGELDGEDLYVLGRLAEIYGFPDLARQYYARVESPEARPVFSITELAARRLEALARRRSR